MNAVNAAVVFDVSHAPEILIVRFRRWPSLQEQQDLISRLTENEHLSRNSSAVLDLSGVEQLPNPDAIAEGLAQAAARSTAFKRVACVVESLDQSKFAETLRMMAPDPNRVQVFLSEADALRWLVRSID